MTEPSPQRTPLLFSAGASSRGVAFAGTHAECVFMGINDFALAKKVTTKLREAAVSAGRQADDLRVFNAATVVVAPTEREVKDLVREYQAFTSEVGNLAIFSSWLDHDLAQYAPNDPIEVVESDGVRSIVDSMRASRGRGPITVGDLARFADVGGREAFIVGTPDQVCDELLRWRDEAGIDGFNLCRTVEPSSLQAFIELVVPRLQERGAYKTAYRPGTMREKLFPGRGPLLQGNHPASRFRVSTSDRIPQQHDVSVGI